MFARRARKASENWPVREIGEVVPTAQTDRVVSAGGASVGMASRGRQRPEYRAQRACPTPVADAPGSPSRRSVAINAVASEDQLALRRGGGHVGDGRVEDGQPIARPAA